MELQAVVTGELIFQGASHDRLAVLVLASNLDLTHNQ